MEQWDFYMEKVNRCWDLPEADLLSFRHRHNLPAQEEEPSETTEESNAAWHLGLYAKDTSVLIYENEQAFLEEFRTGKMHIRDEPVVQVMWLL